MPNRPTEYCPRCVEPDVWFEYSDGTAGRYFPPDREYTLWGHCDACGGTFNPEGEGVAEVKAPPLVAGGQGRDDEVVAREGDLFARVVATVMFLCVALGGLAFAAWLLWKFTRAFH